jgi:uncharacterized protein
MRCLLLFALFLSLSSPLPASDVYTGEVPVPNQDEATRTEAMTAALKQVLVKVSGDPQAAQRPEVQAALAAPAALIQAFYYRQDVDRSGPTPVLKLYYTANFEPRAINRLMASSGLSQWARERPTLMVWVISDSSGSNQFLSDGQLAPLLRRGSERGIELKAATIGGDDGGMAQLTDVERGAVANLRPIASRYGAPGVLAGRLYQTADGVLGRFAYSDGEREESFEIRGTDRTAALHAAADETANRLAARYAFAAADSTPESVTALVRGLRSAADFARVQSYLASLSVVREIHLSAAAADSMSLQLSVAGGAERLRQIVPMNAVLSLAGETSDGAVVLDLR